MQTVNKGVADHTQLFIGVVDVVVEADHATDIREPRGAFLWGQLDPTIHHASVRYYTAHMGPFGTCGDTHDVARSIDAS